MFYDEDGIQVKIVVSEELCSVNECCRVFDRNLIEETFVTAMKEIRHGLHAKT